jgi:DHA2 family multidrug resistance protein
MTSQPTLPSPGRRWLIIITVMAATLMQILDTTIANVALPHMQAALGATPESIVWVLTSYIMMAAIATPITGWLETRFGRRNIFAISIAGFTLSSALCGMATSLEMMVASRALQGIFGAFIGPLGQATMLDSSSREKHPQAMMIWGMGVMIGPIMGPVLGGWLTDNYGWRWVFFINVPIGIVATVGIWLLLDKVTLARRRFDAIGFALVALTLASLQLMLDRGSQRDWFESTEILIEAGLAIGALWMFIVHSFTSPSPLLPLALFRDRNFVLAVAFTMLVMGVMMAGAALVAPMLQLLMGYDAMGAGMMMMPRGIGALISMPIATYLTGKADTRLLIAIGLSLMAGSLWIMTGFDLEMGQEPLIVSGLVQGVGIGFVFLPLNILAFSTLAPHLRTEGAAFYNLARSVGGSITISIMGALLSRNVQVSHSDLAAHLTSTGLPVIQSGMLERFGVEGATVARMIDAEINRQALMIAYLDDFLVMQWVALLALPLILFMRRAEKIEGAPPVHIE